MSEIEWWKKGVFYQIYPRSFMDSNGDGIGDLAGITDRLNYVADLGIDGVWISPCFESPMKDFGYDVSDYRKIDPLFGSNEDFDILLNKAHDLSLKIILDMVMSHTSIEHAWFKESRLGKDNRKADWYVWADPKADGTPPNNWQSQFGGPAWTFDTKRGQYYFHNFLKDQPDLNYHCEAVQKQILSECEFWLERGIDGFRFDVVNFYFHDKNLQDNPPVDPENLFNGIQVSAPYPYTMQSHLYDKSQPENLQFLEKIRTLMEKYPDKMTLAEIGDDNPYKVINEYTGNGKRLHTSYSTDLMSENKIDTKTLILPFKELHEKARNSWPSWAFTNHDTQRVMTRWGQGIKNKASFSILMNKLLLSLRGTPFFYQGDELGLPEATIPFEQIQDPWGKAMWPEWVGRDGCRTPMPWNKDLPAAGFSHNRIEGISPWLPIPQEHREHAVNVQEEDTNSVLNQTRAFIKWRKTQPLLQYGEIDFKEDTHESLIIFDRHNKKGDVITCVFNITENEASYNGKKYAPLSATYIDKNEKELKIAA